MFQAAMPTYPFGSHVAVVEVDIETGHVRHLRHIACDDAGTMVNPMLLAGQVHGGVAQGVAQALYEEVRYDADGNPITSNLADYTMISIDLLPQVERIPMETATHVNPLGRQGHRRVGHDRFHAGRALGGGRRPRPPRRAPHRHAVHAGEGVAGDRGGVELSDSQPHRHDVTDGTWLNRGERVHLRQRLGAAGDRRRADARRHSGRPPRRAHAASGGRHDRRRRDGDACCCCTGIGSSPTRGAGRSPPAPSTRASRSSRRRSARRSRRSGWEPQTVTPLCASIPPTACSTRRSTSSSRTTPSHRGEPDRPQRGDPSRMAPGRLGACAARGRRDQRRTELRAVSLRARHERAVTRRSVRSTDSTP